MGETKRQSRKQLLDALTFITRKPDNEPKHKCGIDNTANKDQQLSSPRLSLIDKNTGVFVRQELGCA